MADCTPNFIPSLTKCVMPTRNESKSRLQIGGTFFRSKLTGTSTNLISVENTWMVCIDGTNSCNINIPTDLRAYNPITDDECTDVVATRLRIFNNSIEEIGSPYTVEQSRNCSPPIWLQNAIDTLRPLVLSSSNIIELPNTDVQIPWNSPSDDADHLSEFPLTFLSGAIGLDNNPSQVYLDSIRTGPYFTLVNIGQSEINTDDGTMENLNSPSYWNGGCWKPLKTGSPPTILCDSDPFCP